jgi:hypothetical protein
MSKFKRSGHSRRPYFVRRNVSVVPGDIGPVTPSTISFTTPKQKDEADGPTPAGIIVGTMLVAGTGGIMGGLAGIVLGKGFTAGSQIGATSALLSLGMTALLKRMQK